MKAITEKKLIINHPSAFDPFVIKFYTQSETAKTKTTSSFFLVNEGWMPIVKALALTFEKMNDEIKKENRENFMHIHHMQIVDKKLDISLSYSKKIDAKWIEQSKLLCDFSEHISSLICESCGHHHMGDNAACGTKCKICFARGITK